MPISCSTLTSNWDSTDTTSVSTASVTPGANKLVLVFLMVRGTAVTSPATGSGNGLTYTKITEVGSSTATNLAVYRAMGSSPTSGAITFTTGGTVTGNGWVVLELSSVDTSGSGGSGAIVQSATNSGTATSGSVTLAAFGSTDNATVGGFAEPTNEAISQGSGFTSMANPFGGLPGASLLGEFRNDNDTGVDASWATSAAWRGIALEIKYASPATSNFFAMF